MYAGTKVSKVSRKKEELISRSSDFFADYTFEKRPLVIISDHHRDEAVDSFCHHLVLTLGLFFIRPPGTSNSLVPFSRTENPRLRGNNAIKLN